MSEFFDDQEIELTVGEILQRQRLKKNLELRDIACELRLREKVLEGIEEGWKNSEQRPPHLSFVKGFVRAYADFLGLDGLELASRYQSEMVGDRKKKEQKTSKLASIKSNRDKIVGNRELRAKVFAKYESIRPGNISLVLGGALLLLVISVASILYDDGLTSVEKSDYGVGQELTEKGEEWQGEDFPKLQVQTEENQQTLETLLEEEQVNLQESEVALSSGNEEVLEVEEEGSAGESGEGEAVMAEETVELLESSRIEVVAEGEVFLEVFERGEEDRIFGKRIKSGEKTFVPEGRQFLMVLAEDKQWQDLTFYIDGIRVMNVVGLVGNSGALLLDGYSLASGSSEWSLERLEREADE